MAWQNYLSNYMRRQQEADQWRDFQNRFMELACEEQARQVAITNGEILRRMDRVLRAYCDYHKHPEAWAERGKPGQGFFCLLKAPETGLWMYSDGVSENFRERVRVFVSRAGVALSPPKGIDAEDFWLHRLYLDMLENNSKLFLCESSQRTNTILSVCLASATFCSRLERQALALAEGGAKAAIIASLDETENLDQPGSAERYQQEVKTTRLALALGDSAMLDRLRTDENQAESAPAQNNAKTAEVADGKSPTAAPAGNMREAFLRPILEKKGLTVNDWATQSGVDFHTANDYLKGKTNPYQSTLSKLAGPLGIEVRDMPA